MFQHGFGTIFFFQTRSLLVPSSYVCLSLSPHIGVPRGGPKTRYKDLQRNIGTVSEGDLKRNIGPKKKYRACFGGVPKNKYKDLKRISGWRADLSHGREEDSCERSPRV